MGQPVRIDSETAEDEIEETSEVNDLLFNQNDRIAKVLGERLGKKGSS